MTSGEDERLTAPCPASLPELSDQDAPFGRITKDSATSKVAREFENNLYSKDTDGTADLAVPLIEYPTLRLEPREARLLVLHPAENAAEHIRCSLETYAITELPSYVAIKNARGYRNFQEVIQVDEEALPISIALERFLRYFRTKIRQPTRIWVRYACVVEFNKQEQKAYWTREFSDFMYEQASEVLDMHETNSRLIESGYFLRIINVNSMKRSKEWYGVPDEVVLPRVCPIRLGTSPNSEAPTMDYQYMPIDMVADEIRIVCVMSAEDVHAPIVIHVAHCPINSEVHYIALSYRWGEDHSQEEVVMNGQKMAIRKNLAQAIRAIRLPDRILPIWIDALSINQKDVLERSRQVPRMGEIYDNAVMVYSYLGEPTEDIDSVLDFINELFNHPMVRTNKEKEFHFPSAKAVAGDDQPAENAIKPNRLAQLCAGLYRLLTRQYFRRAWMLQEVAYASNPLAMVSGRQAIRFDFVESAAQKLEDMLSRDLRLAGRMREADPSLGEIDINMLSYSRKLFYFRHLINRGIGLGVAFHRIGDESPGFLEALVVARDFESTDPTDKIFALWNLARDKCGLDFKPRYGKHYKEVYADFTRAWIDQHHTLDIVGAVEATEQSRAFYDTTPSWTPNWSVAATTSCLIRKDYVPMTLMSCVKDQQGKMYCADGGITRNAFEEPLCYIENRTLYCTGLIVDQIGIILGDAPEIPKWAVFPPCDPASHWRFQCWVSEIEEYLRKHGSEVYDDPLQAAWAMFHGDSPAAWPHRAECDPDQIPTQDPYICKTALSRHVTYYVGGYLPHQAWNVVKNVLRGRRPFISDNGYMGLAPAYIAEQQDLHKNRSWHLAIVAGCSVPLVLGKKDDETYRVVGTCFVQGWMEGEWMEKMMGADSSTEFWNAVKDGAKLAIL